MIQKKGHLSFGTCPYPCALGSHRDKTFQRCHNCPPSPMPHAPTHDYTDMQAHLRDGAVRLGEGNLRVQLGAQVVNELLSTTAKSKYSLRPKAPAQGTSPRHRPKAPAQGANTFLTTVKSKYSLRLASSSVASGSKSMRLRTTRAHQVRSRIWSGCVDMCTDMCIDTQRSPSNMRTHMVCGGGGKRAHALPPASSISCM